MGAQKFFLQMGHYRANAQVKFQTPKFYVGWGRNVLNFFPFFTGQMRRRADLRNCRRYQSAYCARLLDMGKRVQCGGKIFFKLGPFPTNHPSNVTQFFDNFWQKFSKIVINSKNDPESSSCVCGPKFIVAIIFIKNVNPGPSLLKIMRG